MVREGSKKQQNEGLDLRRFALGFLPGAGVLKGDQALRVAFVFEQREFALWEATGEERETLTDKDGNDSDIEFVD